jgi:hypothetical protein
MQTTDSGRGRRACPLALVGAVALAMSGCSYDYSSLGGHAASGGVPGLSGGAGRGGGTGGESSLGAGAGGSGGTAIGSGSGTGGALLDGSGGLGAAGQAGGGVAGTGGATTIADATGGSTDGGDASGGSQAGGSATGGAAPGSGGSGGDSDGTGAGAGGQTTGAAGAGGAQPVVLSIDFIGGRWGTAGAGGKTVTVAPAMSSSEVAGVKPAAAWNGAPGASGSLLGLTLSTGSLSPTIGVTWMSPASASGPGIWTHEYPDAPGDSRMMNGYLDPLSSSAPATVAVTGLPPEITTQGYDVYVYAGGQITSAGLRTCRYTIGTTSTTASQMGPTNTVWPGFTLARDGGTGNYVVFRNMSAPSFTLTATPGANAAVPRAPVNGLQIVSPTGS